MASMSSLHWCNLQFTSVTIDMKTMKNQLMNVHLMPDELYFGSKPVQISALLGSSVAITLWAERSCSGGMCHIVVPNSDIQGDEQHPCYVSGTIKRFLAYLRKYQFEPEELRVGVYGGGHALVRQSEEHSTMIGMRNVQQVNALLHREGFKDSHQDVGGNVYRTLTMNLVNGAVWQSKHAYQACDIATMI